jgi:MFS transporter, FSR family, fosmidomycin resistance protein
MTTINQNKPNPNLTENQSSDQVDRNEDFQAGKVAMVTGAHALHDTYTAFLPSILPILISRWSLSKTEAGLLSIFQQAPSLLQPVFGWLADSVSLRFIVILAPAVTTTLMSLIGVSSSYVIAALLLIIIGLSSASLHATVPVLIGNLSGQNLGRGMSYWMVGGELGRALGPIIIVTTIHWFGIEGTPWLITFGLLTSFLLFLRLRDLPDERPEKPVRAPWRPVLASMKSVMVPLFTIVALNTFLISGFSVFLPTYLTETGKDLWFAGASLSVMEVAGVAGALFGGSISDRIGRRNTLTIAISIAPFMAIAFILTSEWVQILTLLGLGFSAFSIMPVMMAIVQENFPKNRSFANGVYMAGSFVSRSIGIVTIGVIGDFYSLKTAILISAGVMLLAVPVTRFLPQTNGANQ